VREIRTATRKVEVERYADVLGITITNLSNNRAVSAVLSGSDVERLIRLLEEA
jgi:hypothetical protein